MKKLQLLIVLLCLSIAGMAQAQDIPQPVLDAYAHINQVNGTDYNPRNSSWTWEERIFVDTVLDCDWQEGTAQTIVGYRVLISVFGEDQHDVRISYEPDIVIYCQETVGHAGPSNSDPDNTVQVAQTDPRCAGIPIRLRTGEPGRVIPYGIPNNVREGAGTSNSYVGEIPNGGEFTVLDGPQCTAEGAWFQVDYNGMVGWTIESYFNEFFLEPLRPDLERISLDNIQQLQTLAIIPVESVFEIPEIFISGYSIFVGDTELKEYTFDYNPGSANHWQLSTVFTGTGDVQSMDEVYGGLIYVNSAGEVYKVRSRADIELLRTIAHNNLMLHELSLNGDYLVSVNDSVSGGVDFLLYNLEAEADSVPAVLTRTLDDSHISMAFSQDSQYFAVALQNEFIIWETATWTVLYENTFSFANPILDIAFAPDDNRLLISYWNQDSLASGMAFFTINGQLNIPDNVSAGGNFDDIHFASNGETIFTTITLSNTVDDIITAAFALWNQSNLRTVSSMTTVEGATVAPLSMSLSDDGALVVTYDSDNNIRVWGIPVQG